MAAVGQTASCGAGCAESAGLAARRVSADRGAPPPRPTEPKPARLLGAAASLALHAAILAALAWRVTALPEAAASVDVELVEESEADGGPVTPAPQSPPAPSPAAGEPIAALTPTPEVVASPTPEPSPTPTAAAAAAPVAAPSAASTPTSEPTPEVASPTPEASPTPTVAAAPAPSAAPETSSEAAPPPPTATAEPTLPPAAVSEPAPAPIATPEPRPETKAATAPSPQARPVPSPPPDSPRKLSLQARRAAAARSRAAAPAAAATAVAGLGTDAARADYGALALAQIRAHKFYPAAAIEAQESGKVGVTFVIGASGRIASITITRSSGSTILDRAAQAIVGAIALPPPPGGAYTGETRLDFVPP